MGKKILKLIYIHAIITLVAYKKLLTIGNY